MLVLSLDVWHNTFGNDSALQPCQGNSPFDKCNTECIFSSSTGGKALQFSSLNVAFVFNVNSPQGHFLSFFTPKATRDSS